MVLYMFVTNIQRKCTELHVHRLIIRLNVLEYNLCNRLFRNRNVNKFWKYVKRLKNVKNWNQSSVITNETFYNYFSINFKYDIDLESDHIRCRLSKEFVTTKLQNCKQSYDDFVFKE